MKKALLFTALLCLLIAACQHTAKKNNLLLNKNNLVSQLFTITINKDTTLTTAGGALITIPQGALAGGNLTVQLEIKEAYSMQEIVLAGLTTQTNGQPLSSGGMIYINAAAGQSVKITKTLSVKIPTPFIDKNMKLFKGDTDANGKINWIKPDSLPVTPQTAAFNNGKWLFINNCSMCHGIGKDGTGPDLAHILTRTPDKKLLYEFTRNNIKIMAGDNSTENIYYRCLYERRNKTAMTLFPNLSDYDLDNLYEYIENESSVLNLSIIKDEIRPCIDSCRNYWQMKNSLQDQKAKSPGNKIEITNPDSQELTLAETLPLQKNSRLSKKSLYYQFKINTFGWCNVDMILAENNALKSKLLVNIAGEYKKDIFVYLVVPSAKVCQLLDEVTGKENLYGTFEGGRDIWLPQGVQGYIIAMGDVKHNIIFSEQTFSTLPEQTFEMHLSIVTKDFFNTSIKKLNAIPKNNKHGSENAETFRNSAAIVNEPKEIQKMKPKNCDCNCGFTVSDSSLEKK